MTDDKRRYRKIFLRLWANPDFLALGEAEKLMALYLLSGPQTNRVGLFRLSYGLGVEHLGGTPASFRKRLEAVCKIFGWSFDASTQVVWIPSWWDYNDVKENFKVMQGALGDIYEVPNTPLIDRFLQHRRFVPAGLHHLFDRLSVKRAIPDSENKSGIQEQEQKQEQEQEQEHTPDSAARTPESADRPLPAAPTGPTPELLRDTWNTHRDPGPKVTDIDPKRRRLYGAALKAVPDLPDWIRAIHWLNGEDWANAGSEKHPTWRADLDWLVKPGKVRNILERLQTDATAGPRVSARTRMLADATRGFLDAK